MAYQATLEQEQEFISKHDQAKQRLVQAVSALGTDEGFRRWMTLRISTRLGRYSIFNQLMIASQMESASWVAGYRAWQREGRQVRKGSRAIWVFAPIRRTWDEADEEGNMSSHVQVSGFTVVPVFDVSSTVGPALPNFRISPTGNTMHHWLTRLQVYAMSLGILVEVGDTGDADGFYSRKDNVIHLSGRLDTDGMVHCLVHELVHAAGIGYAQFGRQSAEIITEIGANIICAELGLSTVEESSFYVMSWANGDVDKILAHLKAADEVAKSIEKGLGLGLPGSKEPTE